MRLKNTETSWRTKAISLNSPLQKLHGGWVQAFGVVFLGSFGLTSVSYAWTIAFKTTNISEGCPPK